MIRLKRVAELPKKSQSRIRTLIDRKKLHKYVENNYVCYDIDEFIEYQNSPRKRGRPIKM